MSDTYEERLNILKASASKAIEESGLPVKVAGIVMEWDLPDEAAAAMPQGLMLTGSASLDVPAAVRFMHQVSRFNLALTEHTIRAAIAGTAAANKDKSEVAA